MLTRAHLIIFCCSLLSCFSLHAGQWQLIERIARPANHFTQGLVFVDGRLYESVGMRGRSALIAYQADHQTIAKQVANRADVHAEGLVFLNGRFYQGSWQSREIFVFDRELNQLVTLTAPSKEVWGLTTDGQDLIITDSSDQLLFLDPQTAALKKTVTVFDKANNRWHWLNELEWIDGFIFANIWHSNIVVKIDPASGEVVDQYDFSELTKKMFPFLPKGEQVLNGLAWQPHTKALWLTGKEWPFWFSVQLDPVDKTDSAH